MDDFNQNSIISSYTVFGVVVTLLTGIIKIITFELENPFKFLLMTQLTIYLYGQPCDN